MLPLLGGRACRLSQMPWAAPPVSPFEASLLLQYGGADRRDQLRFHGILTVPLLLLLAVGHLGPGDQATLVRRALR